MNLNKSNLRATASLLFLISQVGAQEPKVATDPAVKTTCSKQPGFIGGPFVPTVRAARRIYLAVAHEIAPEKLKEYPLVTVEDAGDHWYVSQTRHHPHVRLPPNTISVDFGGGQLYMQIDKCSGAISGAAYNR
jgi:hypothetical protein